VAEALGEILDLASLRTRIALQGERVSDNDRGNLVNGSQFNDAGEETVAVLPGYDFQGERQASGVV
jgi:hypothetical protein